jgi:tyrosine-protein kinase Etk/Wzc
MTPNPPISTVVLQTQPEEPSIDLFEILVKIIAEWKFGLATAIVVFLLGIVYTYRIPPQFEATATILPKQSFAESNSLTTLFSGKRPADLYTGLLRSRSVTDNVIRELKLIPPDTRQSWEAMRASLMASLTVLIGPDGLVRLTIRNTDAQMAMKVANAYLDGLNQQQQTMALTQEVLNRKFYEQQLQVEKDALVKAEKDLEQTQLSTGIIQAGSQSAAGLGQIAGFQGQIDTMQVQLAGLLQSETEDNPQVKTLRSQIAQMQSQQRNMQTSSSTGAGAPIPAGRIPAANLEYQRKQREVSFHEAQLNSLALQAQNARLAEASSADAFQVVDYALAPERKSYPPRTTYLIASALIAFAVAILIMCLVLVLRKIRADADYQRHTLEVRRIFGLAR